MKIGIATYVDVGRYISPVPNEDEMVLHLFREKGHEAAFVVWDDDGVKWAEFDLIVIKSTWDYFIDKFDHFHAWLTMLEEKGIPCLNPVEIIKWNADKHYLRDIERKGFPVIPTTIMERGSQFDPSCFDTFGSDDLVVKPCISGGAKNTIRISRTEDQHELINNWLQEEAYMVQPFAQEIINEGEWSFIFFNGEFSHHILKTVARNEFRVQHFFGGNVMVPELPHKLLQQAQAITDEFAKNCLYARVDGINVNGEFRVVELELIEPYLFFYKNELALENYYRAFETLIKKI